MKTIKCKLLCQNQYFQSTGVVKCRFSDVYSICLDSDKFIPLRLKKARPFPGDKNVLSFDYFCRDYIGCIILRIVNKNVWVRNIEPGNEWQRFSVDLSEHLPLIQENILTYSYNAFTFIILPSCAADCTTFKIKNVCFRSYTSEEEQKYDDRKKWSRVFSGNERLSDYSFTRDFKSKITGVKTSARDIVISGKLEAKMPDLYLAEIKAYHPFDSEYIDSVEKIITTDDSFEVAVPRYTAADNLFYDRIYSRWVLVCNSPDGYILASDLRYTDTVDSANRYAPIEHRNKKGLGDFSFNQYSTDLDELDVSYITVNIRLNDFLRLSPTENTIPFNYGGRTYYADKEQLSEYDSTIRCASEKGIDVVAIILVYPEVMSRDKKAGRLLEHPQCQCAGVYTMPNLTNSASFNLYVAALDFLTSRYNRPDRRYGRIHKWIAHNEIDSGNVWTNAGDKEIAEYMDLYVQSMRLIYYTALKYNSDSEVFISLSHFWTMAHDEPNCYPGRHILYYLTKFCEIEGDFRWGVALHPYPENLLEPRSWLDTLATFSEDTRLITFKNLKVLDEWIKNARVLYKGKYKRTLLLSEQNPNSIDYSDAAQADQAAALAYVWKKVSNYSGIDAYIAHSWIDARFEAGLRTGLRKYSDDLSDPCGRKKAWFVFQAAGTDREDEKFEFAKKIIRIEKWDDIIGRDL